MSRQNGFTLVELLVVIAIIGLLASIVLASLNMARNKGFEARAQVDLNSLATAMELYVDSNNNMYPPDMDRGLPSGIEKYLPGGVWPEGPWPGSTYDWENWAPGDLSYPPYQQVYQISVRFCPKFGPLSACNFPDVPWIDSSWGINSAAYYCISGPCRSHNTLPENYPGHCLGGAC